jgi:hypothetical protein
LHNNAATHKTASVWQFFTQKKITTLYNRLLFPILFMTH